MVTSKDVKFYKSIKTGSLGRRISSNEIISGTSNNLYDTITQAQAAAGRIEYKCFYVKNNHATEAMEDVDIFLKSDNKATAYSKLEWGLEYNPNGYHYGPAKFYDGSSVFDAYADDPSLDLSNFTVTGWFQLPDDNSSVGYIVNKGENSGTTEGMNYAVYNETDGKISAFFYDTTNTIRFLTSTLTYKDGLWHCFCYRRSNGSGLTELFIDDMQTAVASNTWAVTPRTNTKQLVIGRYSFSSSAFYYGHIDQVRIWNRALSLNERNALRDDNNAPGNGKVFVQTNGDKYDGSTTAQAISTTTVAPVGVVWLGVTNGPVSNTPNIGHLEPLQSFPVWIKKTISAGAEGTEDDNATFEIRGKVPDGGTSGGDPDNPDEPPAPQTNTAFTFVLVGDFGTESATDDVVDEIVKINPKLVISLGDNNYDDSPSKWYPVVKRIDDTQGSKIRLETVFGNHDNGESESSSFEDSLKSHFGYKNTWNFFTIENVHFIIIDNTTETDFDIGSTQYNAVKADLEKVRPNGQVSGGIDWIVVCFHKPMFGRDTKHSYNDGDFNDQFGALFNKHKIDVCAGGHNHNWQATKQVTYDKDDPENPQIEDSSSPYVGGKGFVHFVSGTGGHDSGGALYKFKDNDPGPGFIEYSDNSTNGVLKCVLSNNNKTLTCSFVGIDNQTEHSIVINR